MHEWGIVQDLLDEVKRQADRNGIAKVTRVRIALGKKADLTERALTTCFKALAQDPVLAGARLLIDKTPDHRVIVDTIEGKQAETHARGAE